jgi:beta-lactamase class A
MLLNQQMDLAVFKKTFTDLGLSDPDMSKSDIPITARQYSLFMRVLFNATYLNIQDSEYCTELLSHSDFKTGLVNGIPGEMKVAHKFGEANDGINAHFGESGIIYLNNSPYLLTVPS